MKIIRVVFSVLVIVLLIFVHAISMTLIKNEDFIGTYYSVNIKPDVIMETCGTCTRIIDQKENETIISDIDSMTVVDDAIYGICKNRYYLLNLLSREIVYSSTPMLQYSTCNLLSPWEYYQKKTMYIDIIGYIVLLCCIIVTIKIGFFHGSRGRSRGRF